MLSNLTRYLPQVLTGMAAAGEVATIGCAISDTMKASKYISSDKKNVKEIAKCYVPTAVAGAFTLACIFGANKSHLRLEALMGTALAGAYEYRDKVKEVIGKEKEKDIYNEHQKAKASKEMNEKLPPWEADSGKMWCYEPISKQYFQTTMEKLLWAELILNKELNSTWGIRFNKYLKLIGCKPYKHGEQIGWFACDSDGFWDYNWSYFAHGGNPWVEIRPILTEVDGQEVMMIVYDVQPDYNPDDESEKEEE